MLGSDAMQTYLDARKRANDAFEERQNRLIDPVYLAMAQGFLAPTKTGSFGESLGNSEETEQVPDPNGEGGDVVSVFIVRLICFVS